MNRKNRRYWKEKSGNSQSSIALLLILLSLILFSAIVLLAGCEMDSLYLDSIEQKIEEDIDFAGPDIQLKVNDGNYSSGQTVTVAWAYPNETVNITVNIQNNGSESLSLTGDPTAELENMTGNGFSITGYPESTVVPGSETSLFIEYSPDSEGVYVARISIQNNDSDESEFELYLEASCLGYGSVISPESGDAYEIGTDCEIQWIQFSGGSNVVIDLLKDGVLDSVISTGSDDDGAFTWMIPAAQSEGDDYKIRVTSMELSTEGTSATFAIGSINGVDPNGSEKLRPGDNPSITWNSGLGGLVDIELWKGGLYYSDIASSVSNSGAYSGWTVPSCSDDDFRIRVLSTSNTSIYDESDGDFAIGTISGILPTGGAFLPGAGTTISWSSDIGGTVKLELLKNGVVQGSAIALSTTNDGSYSWTTPAGGSGTGYKIRVTSNENPSIYSESADSFSIGRITVTDPNGGESFDQGDSTSISWTSDLGGSVKIRLLRNGSLYGPDIVSSKDNTSGFSHPWTIPSAQKPGVSYRVRISSNLNPAIYDDSNADFKITGWDSYGEYAGTLGAEMITFIDLQVGNDGNPVIAYIDSSNNAIVKRWNGLGWTNYGSANYAPVYNPQDQWAGDYRSLSMGLDASNGIYLAYFSNDPEDPVANFRVRMTRLSSTGSKSDYGYGTSVSAFGISMGVDYYNRVNIAYLDGSDTVNYPTRVTSNYASVWSDRGSFGGFMGQMSSIAIGNWQFPIVASVPTNTSTDFSSVQVYKYNSGTSWTNLGTPSGATEGILPAIASRINTSTISPYVSYKEGDSLDIGSTIRVKKFTTGTSWTDLGSVGTGKMNDIELHPTTYTPYVVFQDYGNSLKATIKAYASGTTWTNLGSYEAMNGYGTFDVHIDFDVTDNMPIIAFYDAAGYVRVVKLVH